MRGSCSVFQFSAWVPCVRFGASPSEKPDRVFEHWFFGDFVFPGAIRIKGLPTEQGDTVCDHDLLDSGCSIRGGCKLFATPSFPGAFSFALVHDAETPGESATVLPVLPGFALGDFVPICERWRSCFELEIQL